MGGDFIIQFKRWKEPEGICEKDVGFSRRLMNNKINRLQTVKLKPDRKGSGIEGGEK